MKIDPSANGNLGWVCILGGSPGTWQPFGYAGDISNGYFARGGNTNGTNQILGTNDAFALSLRTGGVSRLTIPNNNNNIINAVNNGYGNLYFGDASNSPFIQRDTADAISAFAVRLINASSTGHILDLRNDVGVVAYVDRLGNYVGKGINTFNTTDQVTNYETVRQYWASNIYNIASERGGTGVARAIRLSNGTASILNLANSGITATSSDYSFVMNMTNTLSFNPVQVWQSNGTPVVQMNQVGELEFLVVSKGPIIKSPDGTRYRIVVANGGALSTVAA